TRVEDHPPSGGEILGVPQRDQGVLERAVRRCGKGPARQQGERRSGEDREEVPAFHGWEGWFRGRINPEIIMSTRRVPLFPLNVVLFPGMPLPLHVFEPRYQEMVQACMESDRTFGVCLIRSGQEVGGPADPHPVGTTCEILEASSLGEGRMQ